MPSLLRSGRKGTTAYGLAKASGIDAHDVDPRMPIVFSRGKAMTQPLSRPVAESTDDLRIIYSTTLVHGILTGNDGFLWFYARNTQLKNTGRNATEHTNATQEQTLDATRYATTLDWTQMKPDRRERINATQKRLRNITKTQQHKQDANADPTKPDA